MLDDSPLEWESSIVVVPTDTSLFLEAVLLRA